MAKLARAVIVPDPNRRRDLIFQPGEEPAPEYAVLITNPACWEGGKLPVAVKRALAAKDKESEGGNGEGNQGNDDGAGKGDGSGEVSDDSDTGDTEQAAPAAKKTAAKKAAHTPARGRSAAAEGTSGD